jgi:hypothetical protein
LETALGKTKNDFKLKILRKALEGDAYRLRTVGAQKVKES